MDNSQIRDCVLAQRSAEFDLEVKISIRYDRPELWIGRIVLTIGIKNVSSVAAISPFVEIMNSSQAYQIAVSEEIFQRRQLELANQYGYYSGANFILHAGSSIDICSFEFFASTFPKDFGLYFGDCKERSFLDWKLAHDIKIREDEFGDTHTDLVRVVDEFGLSMSFGAINAVRKWKRYECTTKSMGLQIAEYLVGLRHHLEIREVT